jgi:hypothetical protein
MIEKFDPNDDEQLERMRHLLNPEMIDMSLRQAIRFAWMMLPQEKRTIEETEKQFRRMVDRAFRDMREDHEQFFGKDVE